MSDSTKIKWYNNAHVLVWTFVILNLWDLAATLIVVSRQGVELLPATKYILDTYGPLGLTCYKILVPAIISKFLYNCKVVQIVRILIPVNILMFLACIFMTFSALMALFLH